MADGPAHIVLFTVLLAQSAPARGDIKTAYTRTRGLSIGFPKSSFLPHSYALSRANTPPTHSLTHPRSFILKDAVLL